jgi:hypothetical protein
MLPPQLWLKFHAKKKASPLMQGHVWEGSEYLGLREASTQQHCTSDMDVRLTAWR